MNIVLGVSGSVAAYRAADLARELMRAGHVVRVCLTDAAEGFVTPALFEALTGQPCLSSVFEEPDRGHMAHIEWARWASAVVVAPATANTISKIAHGLGDDMLTTLVLATTAPLVVAPAMNPLMYANPAFLESLNVLRERAAVVVEPVEGDVACGENGQGKLASIAEISAAVRDLLAYTQLLAGRNVLITSGPTQEPIDDVRFLSNRSSGKMGAALARAALMMGAEVTVLAGPSPAIYPPGARVVPVRTAEEMLHAGLWHAPKHDLIIGAAAVADYRPRQRAEGKVRRSSAPISLELVPNEDVIAALALANPSAVSVGFAAEAGVSLPEVRRKLQAKGLAAIAANNISDDTIGFDSNQNDLTLVFASGTPHSSGRQSKLNCARWLLERIAALESVRDVEPATPERPV